jgi:hypothetical protein
VVEVSAIGRDSGGEVSAFDRGSPREKPIALVPELISNDFKPLRYPRRAQAQTRQFAIASKM